MVNMWRADGSFGQRVPAPGGVIHEQRGDDGGAEPGATMAVGHPGRSWGDQGGKTQPAAQMGLAFDLLSRFEATNSLDLAHGAASIALSRLAGRSDRALPDVRTQKNRLCDRAVCRMSSVRGHFAGGMTL
jgi:hypothetical protein